MAEGITIRITMESPQRAAAPVRAREESMKDRLVKKQGALGRLMRGAVRARTAARAAASGFSEASWLARFGRAATNPATLAVTAGIIAALAVTRLATGRSFENMGENARAAIFGKMTSKARGAMETRAFADAHPELLRIIGEEGGMNAQVRKVLDDVNKMRTRDALGRELVEQDPHFQSNNAIDMLILKAADKTVEAFKASGGMAAIEAFKNSRRGVKGGGR